MVCAGSRSAFTVASSSVEVVTRTPVSCHGVPKVGPVAVMGEEPGAFMAGDDRTDRVPPPCVPTLDHLGADFYCRVMPFPPEAHRSAGILGGVFPTRRPLQSDDHQRHGRSALVVNNDQTFRALARRLHPAYEEIVALGAERVPDALSTPARAKRLGRSST